MEVIGLTTIAKLPVIITESDGEEIKTMATDVANQSEMISKKPEIMLYVLLALTVIFAVIAVIALVLMIKMKVGRQDDKGNIKRKEEAAPGNQPKRVAVDSARKEVSCPQVSVPNRNDQIYPEIVLIHMEHPDIVYRVNICEHIVIGRSEESDIRIKTDAAVSSRHCKILVKGTQFYLEDCNSTNGTRYNDREVTTQIPILSGGILEIGHARYRLEIGNK